MFPLLAQMQRLKTATFNEGHCILEVTLFFFYSWSYTGPGLASVVHQSHIGKGWVDQPYERRKT